MEERYLSLVEACEILGKSERTLYRWIKSGKLKAYKPGRDYEIPESAIEEMREKSLVYPKDLEPPLFDDLVEESRAIAERKRRDEREWYRGVKDLDDFELQRRAEELGNEALRWVGEDPKRWEQAAQRHFVVRLLLKIRADTATENEKRQLERLIPA